MLKHIGLTFAAALLLAGCAETMETGPKSAERENLIVRKAVVQTVDVEGRQVLLRGESGRMLSLDIGPEVRNLDQLESGDVVRLEYYESVAVKMADTSTPGEVTSVEIADRAPEGEKPGIAAGSAVNLVVTFVSYDPETSVVTFTMPDGTLDTTIVKPEMRAFAEARRPGDRVDVTIIRGLAISIEETTG